MIIRRPDKSSRDSKECLWFRPERGKLLLAVLILVFQACRSQPAPTVAAELIGNWTTDHPKHAGLYFNIYPSGFSFSKMDGTVEVHTLTNYEKVEAIVKKRKTVVHVLKDTRPGQEITFRLAYQPGNGGSFTFSNREQVVWTRQVRPTQ